MIRSVGEWLKDWLRDSWGWVAAVVIMLLLVGELLAIGRQIRPAAAVVPPPQAVDCGEAMDRAIAEARLADGPFVSVHALRSIAWSVIYANVCGP